MSNSDGALRSSRVRAAAAFAARVREFSDELRAWRASVGRFQDEPPPKEKDVLEIIEWQDEELSVAEEELRTQSEELERAVALAHVERRRYREVFQVAFDALIVTDRAGVIVESNHAAAKLLASDARFLHGRPFAKLVDERDARSVSERAADARERMESRVKTRIRRSDGAWVGVELTGVPVEDGARVLWRAIPSSPRNDAHEPAAERIIVLERRCRDADDLLAHERAARRRLEEENRMLRRFFAVVARDLAGPVNAVQSWSETLRNEFHAREARTRAMSAIERSAQTMRSILERLFDMPRVVADEVRLDVSVIDVAALARSVVERFANAAADGGIMLRAQDTGAAFVFGDRRRLEQIFDRLIENAIRFTPGGGTIDVIVARAGELVELTIADTGRGLDATQLRAVLAGTVSGTGHYLVRRLAEVHGGTIDVRSDGSGKGTTVVVRLPAREPEAPEAAPSAPSDVLDGARVLLVEDDLDARDVVAAVLGHRGATVASARDGHEALALVRTFAPHVIVSTIGSSEIDGFTLVRRLRHEAPSASAIALGVASRAEALRGAGYAFELQLPRPLDPTQLVEAVRELLARDDEG